MSDAGRPATAVRGAVTDSRGAAADVLADMRGGDLLDGAFERRTVRLDPRDRRWTRELLYGMLRRRSWIDALLDDRVRGGLAKLDPDLIDLLRIGAYQLLAMGSVPAYAAIGQTVELAKRRHGIGASKLANAVLRRLDRERERLVVATPEDPVEALALEQSHPRWLVARWIARWGADETRRLLEANNRRGTARRAPVSTSCASSSRRCWRTPASTVADAPLVPDSLVLTSGVGAMTELGAFKQGLFHLQDPASTLVTRYASIPTGARRRGSLRRAWRQGARAGAHRERRVRRRRVARTAGAGARQHRAGSTRATSSPSSRDARFPAVRGVDAVLVDVPCTGTGTFRRHPDARWRLRISDLAVLPAMQRSIIRAAASAVRPGGLLIYSTCSLETEENDAQVESFLSDNPEWRLEPPPEGVVPATVLDAGRLRVLPQRHGTDGAFAARLRRVDSTTA